MNHYTQAELLQLGFETIGNNVSISKKASFYGIGRISIGNDVRIDDFCVLSAGSGGINIGNNIHIGIHSSIIGAGSVILADYCNISARVSIYSSNDDYSGEFMSNPTIDSTYTNVSSEVVLLEKHVIVGCGSVILPGVTLAIGTAIGALSLVKESTKAFGIYAGRPVKYIKERKQSLLELTKIFEAKKGIK